MGRSSPRSPCRSFRERHGLEGGEANADSEALQKSMDATGAVVMGRRMFSGGEGPWGADPNADGWWGDEPPFRVPVFVLTHHERAPVTKTGGTSFAFVTDGVESAVARANQAAGDKDVALAGGANAIQQALAVGLVDELLIHLAPLLLGGGTSLFAGRGAQDVQLERLGVVDSPAATHLRFAVERGRVG